jgi:hypothetical protein
MFLGAWARGLRLLARRFDLVETTAPILVEITRSAHRASRTSEERRLSEPTRNTPNHAESLMRFVRIGTTRKDTARKCVKTRRAAKVVPTRRPTNG